MVDANDENPEYGCLVHAVGERSVRLKSVGDAEMERPPTTDGGGEQGHRSREDVRYGTVAVVKIAEIDGYIERNGFGPLEHPCGPLHRVMVPDPDLGPQDRGVDRDIVPESGDEHESGQHQRILVLFGWEHAQCEDGCEEFARKAVDRGGALCSDGLFESGFDFFAFCAKIRDFRLEEEESLSEVGDGEVR